MSSFHDFLFLFRYLDREGPPIDHYAVSKRCSTGLLQAIAIGIGGLTTVMLLAALGLQIWQTIEPPPEAVCNDTSVGNSTTHQRLWRMSL